MEKHLIPIRWTLLAVAYVLTCSVGMAQKPNSAPTQEFSYAMEGGSGTNASAVAWNSQKGVYVTVIAGNSSFPLEVFDGNGNPKAQGEANFDWRGLWFNPATGKLEGNGAGDYGWATLSLGDDLSPSNVKTLEEGQLQPDFQSVGAYDHQKKQVVFLDYSVDGLALYSRKNPKKIKQVNLGWGKESDLGDMNSTTVGFTGHKGYEYVLLDYNHGKLIYFDRSGKHTATSKLPGDAPLNESFAFSFAHDRAFLYDKDARIWYAYKVF